MAIAARRLEKRKATIDASLMPVEAALKRIASSLLDDAEQLTEMPELDVAGQLKEQILYAFSGVLTALAEELHHW
jgi:hypothetical protein